MKCISKSKQELLRIFTNQPQLIEKVNRECIDGKSYAWCKDCGNWVNEPKSELQPDDWAKGGVICVKCLKKSYIPKLMYANLEDEHEPIRLGETYGPKKWFWHCSNCSNREEMHSHLKKTYVKEQKQNSFVISMPMRKKSRDSLSTDDKQDLQLFGYSSIGAYKVERQEPPPT